MKRPPTVSQMVREPNHPRPTPERAWLDLVRRGDMAAFERLFRAYAADLADFAAWYVGSDDEARGGRPRRVLLAVGASLHASAAAERAVVPVRGGAEPCAERRARPANRGRVPRQGPPRVARGNARRGVAIARQRTRRQGSLPRARANRCGGCRRGAGKCLRSSARAGSPMPRSARPSASRRRPSRSTCRGRSASSGSGSLPGSKADEGRERSGLGVAEGCRAVWAWTPARSTNRTTNSSSASLRGSAARPSASKWRAGCVAIRDRARRVEQVRRIWHASRRQAVARRGSDVDTPSCRHRT